MKVFRGHDIGERGDRKRLELPREVINWIRERFNCVEATVCFLGHMTDPKLTGQAEVYRKKSFDNYKLNDT